MVGLRYNISSPQTESAILTERSNLAGVASGDRRHSLLSPLNAFVSFNKRDLIFSVATGLITGFSVWRIFVFLNVPKFGGVSYAWLMVIVPILWILGVNLGLFLGKWLSFFNQFGKFVAIGFTNAAVDFGVLNLLIFITGIATGIWYPVFKIISFTCAVIPSFFWNKYWAFEAGKTGKGWTEFLKFISVMVAATLVNTGTASLVVNFVHPVFGLSNAAWANVGAVCGSAVALIFSFTGFKVAVFKVEDQKEKI
jgi:putative flippase GtrA